MGFCATWARQTIFSSSSLPIIGYGVDRLLSIFFSVYKFRFFFYIVTWADTATNTQAAQSPRRSLWYLSTGFFMIGTHQTLSV
jgi:hypothetical protein